MTSLHRDCVDPIETLAYEIVKRLGDERHALRSSPIMAVAAPEVAARLRSLARPGNSRPIADVVADAETIFAHRVRMDHPRFFGFIPSPVSPVSWLGETLTSGFNPHAGSWMQSSGPSAIEAGLIAWLAERAGLPANSGGLFVSGGSMANLTGLVVARDRMLAPQDRPRGVAYVSAQTHSSVAKGLAILGFLPDQVRKVAVDDRFRMDPAALAEAIGADRAEGRMPFAVVASCGTTNTGSIDPLAAIADVAARDRLWMHVDGAYGASIVLSGTHRALADGLGRADSVSWDAHKWLFQTYGCGILLVRDRRHLLESFATSAEYLRDAPATEAAPNFWDFGMELTRPARAMKLWFTLQVIGEEALGRMIDHGFELAETVERALRALPDWQIVSPASLAIVTFRYTPSDMDDERCDALNGAISRQVMAENIAAPLTTRIDGRTVLRICAINPDTSIADMSEVVAALDACAIALRAAR